MDRATQRILEIARGVLVDLDLDVVLRRVLDAAQELTQARYAALGVLNESRSELARFVTSGIDEHAAAAIGSLPRGRGVLGALIEDPRPLRLADVGEHPRSYGLPPGHPQMRTFLGVPITIDGIPFGNLYLTEKAGGAEFSKDDEEAVCALAEFAGIAIDHARRYSGASQRRDELERTVATLEATTQIARAIGGETDPAVVLALVAKRGRALVSARALVIELTRGKELEIAAGAGELPRDVLGSRVPLQDTVAAEAMKTGRAQRLEEASNRARFEQHGGGSLGLEAQTGLLVSLVFRGETHGVLVALDRLTDGPAFSSEDERLLEAFAATAATAVATAEAVVAERQRQRLAATEEERRRWARELHDETLQSMSALRLGLAAARRSDRLDSLIPALDDAVDQLEQTISNLRALITDLRPAALDELGLQAAIEALAERNSRFGIDVDVNIALTDDPQQRRVRLHTELETALYRIVQEALTNAYKHGHASRAIVEISRDAESIALSVRDDGDGFDPEAGPGDGFGLLGMRERVALVGGELRIDSSPGNGAIISARIPLSEKLAYPSAPPAATPSRADG